MSAPAPNNFLFVASPSICVYDLSIHFWVDHSHSKLGLGRPWFFNCQDTFNGEFSFKTRVIIISSWQLLPFSFSSHPAPSRQHEIDANNIKYLNGQLHIKNNTYVKKYLYIIITFYIKFIIIIIEAIIQMLSHMQKKFPFFILKKIIHRLHGQAN